MWLFRRGAELVDIKVLLNLLALLIYSWVLLNYRFPSLHLLHCCLLQGVTTSVRLYKKTYGNNEVRITLLEVFRRRRLLSDLLSNEAVLYDLLDAFLLNRSLHKSIALREDLELHLRYVLNDVVPSLASRLNA